VIKELNLV